MTEIELLINEIDRGPQDDMTPGQRTALHIAWAPFDVSYRDQVTIRHGYISHAARQARLMFYTHVAGRRIRTSDELTSGEAMRLRRWLTGEHPSPGIATSEDVKNQRHEDRVYEVVEWLTVPSRKLIVGRRAAHARHTAAGERAAQRVLGR